MPRTRRTGKKPSSALSPEARERILAAALEHPGLGVRRLARVLTDMGIPASESAVRAALKREGLHTRELRLRRLEERHLAEGLALSDVQRQALEKFNPGWLERRKRMEVPVRPPEGRVPTETAEPETPAVAEKEPEPALAGVFAPPAVELAVSTPSPPRPSKKAERRPGWERWLFRGVNAGLVCLAVYFGWAVASKLVEPEWQGGDKALNAAVRPAAPTGPGGLRDEAPPDDYHVVWERDLFGTSRTDGAGGLRGSAAVEKIAVAEKNLGLKLIGTAVTGDPKRNYAVITVAGNHEQSIFRERERVGRAVIRRILRNTVIIQTDAGQRRRLTVEEEVARGSQAAAAPLPNIYGVPAPAPEAPEVKESAVTIKVPRQAVEPMADTRRLVEETRMSPHLDDGGPDGLRLDAVTPGNPLARVGLRTGDVIKSVDGEAVNSPEDVELLIDRLAEGGNFSILVNRGGQLQSLNLSVK
jgi:type II secretion system protein C